MENWSKNWKVWNYSFNNIKCSISHKNAKTCHSCAYIVNKPKNSKCLNIVQTWHLHGPNYWKFFGHGPQTLICHSVKIWTLFDNLTKESNSFFSHYLKYDQYMAQTWPQYDTNNWKSHWITLLTMNNHSAKIPTILYIRSKDIEI